MNVLREKLVFVATKNSMFDLIKLKRELKAGKVMLGYSSNDLTWDRQVRQWKKKFKQDLEQYKEEDVKEALRKGKKLISYSSTEPL